MRRILLSVAVFASLCGVSNAAPVNFNFESTPPGNYSSLAMTQNGLTGTITRTTGGQFTVQTNGSGYPASFGNRTLQNFNFAFVPGDAYNMNFSSSLSSVSINFGDFGPSDDDSPVTVMAYSGLNGTGALLGSASTNWNGSASFPNFGTLGITANGIQSIRFSGGGSTFANSLFWDNITVEAVPEPASMALFGGLVALGGVVARRRMAKATA